MESVIVYRCKCGKEYAEKYPAELCCLPALTPRLKVGDIVMMGYGCGWFDGDVRWVVNPKALKHPGVMPSPPSKKPPRNHGNCFDKCCTMGFYYVVTAITRDEHRLSVPRIHLLTKAMGKRINAYPHFYNYEEYLEKVKRPPRFVVKDSRSVIGRKTKHFGS